MARANELQSTRFELRREIGHGGMGVVYEAYDHETDSVIALKTLRHYDADTLYRFKHEFRALADLQHPNLVRFGELYCERGQWFFTMELVRGIDFLAYVRPARGDAPGRDEDGKTVPISVRLDADGKVVAVPGAMPEVRERGYDETRLRAALRQLALAIDAVHRSQRVHRDIKPSNVLVREDGHLLLLDFGLIEEAYERPGAAADNQLPLVGTPAFVAPEQLSATRVGPEADWYSFGTMLFLALTGYLPFRGAPDEIMAAKQSLDPPAPRDLYPDVPADLDALCRELLHRDPSRRAGVERILAVLDASDGGGRDAAPRPRLSDDVQALFVGRQNELAALVDSLEACRRGQSVSVVVEGEPGVGKSALVRHFLEEHVALDPRAVILAGRCYEQEALPFKAFDALVDSLALYLANLDEARAKTRLRAGARYLASVFPVLRRAAAVAAQASEREVDNPLALRAQAFHELKRLLAAIADEEPLVIFIDDLQWADRDSLALLQYLVEPEDAPRCLFVATRRTASDEAASALGELLRGFRRVRVGGLPRGESQALWSQLWGSAADAVGERQLDQLLTEAAGHPLFLSELVRYARTLEHNVPVHTSLQEVLWRRISGLEPSARRIMELVALAGAPIKFHVVARAAGLEVNDSLHLLTALRIDQMIRVSRRGDVRVVEPYHDRVREAIVEHLRRDEAESSRTRELHLRLGRLLLESTAPDDLPEQVFTIVHHLHSATALIVDRDERRRVAELDLLAARQARLATAYEAAVEYLERGLALLDEDAWRDGYALTRDLHVERMEAEYLAGRRDAAVAHFAELLPRLGSEPEVAALYVSKIGLDTGHGLFADAIATGRAALTRFGLTLPRKVTTPSVLQEYAAIRWAQGRRQIPELADLPQLDDVPKKCAMQVLIALAPPAFFADTALLSLCLMRIARLSIQHGLTDVSSYGFAGYGLVLSGAFLKHDEAHELGALALRLNERFANHRLASKLYHLNGTFLTPWVRPFAEAKEQLRVSGAMGLKNGDTAYEAYAAATLSGITFCESRTLAEVQATAESSRAITSRRRDDDMTGVVSAHARFAAALTRPDGGRDLGQPGSSDAELRQTLSDGKTPTAMFYYFFCNGLLAYLDGDMERASELIAEAARRPAGIFSIPTTAELCLMELLVSAERYRRASFVDRLRLEWTMRQRLGKLRKWARTCPQNFAAQYQIARAAHAHAHGAAHAGALFDEAAATARQHEAPWREALANELGSRWFAARGQTQEAQQRADAAADAYTRWGATRKAATVRAGAPTNG